MKILRYYTRSTSGIDDYINPSISDKKNDLLDFKPLDVHNEEDAYNKCLEYLTNMKKRSIFSLDDHKIRRIESGYEATRGKRLKNSEITISDIVVFEIVST